MKSKLSALLLAGLAATTFLSACTQTTSGTPAPSQQPAPESSTAVSTSSVPKVSNPLPQISEYVDKPCDLVPATLVSQLGFSNPTATDSTDVLGSGCDWIDTKNSRSMSVALGILHGNPNGGIAKIMQLNGSLFTFVEPFEVSGYPAAYADGQDRRAQGNCNVFVGATDEVAFSTNVIGYTNAQDSCGAAKQIAAAVITKLQGG